MCRSRTFQGAARPANIARRAVELVRAMRAPANQHESRIAYGFDGGRSPSALASNQSASSRMTSRAGSAISGPSQRQADCP